ncbi:MAG TPA: ribulose-phosphate 3-epimerase [Terriglobia bacterium]|nr:ribulose-phosphate 3-epimerase [Terriglobia bacterium]
MSRPAPIWIDHLPTGRLIVEASLWSADLLNLAGDLARVRPHVDLLHIDVADGHFAPALLFFPDLVAAIRKISGVPIHVHLMTTDDILLQQIDQFAEAGSDLISIHVENEVVRDRALDRLDARRISAGMVVKVNTPVARVAPYLSRLRFLTLLGTEIGVKGQGLDKKALDRLREAKRLITATRTMQRIVLAADGGIRENTVPLLLSAGAETVVAGSLLFGAPDLLARLAWLHAL